MTQEELKNKICEILNNVEFLHGVPVSAPEEIKDKIFTLASHYADEKKMEFGENMTETDKLMALSFWFINQAHETNATEFKTTQTGVTRFGESIGDWEIICRKIDPINQQV